MLRFSIPAFVLGFLVLSVALASPQEKKWHWAWVGAVGVSALFCIPEYLSISTTRYDGWGIWTGREARVDYVRRRLGPDLAQLIPQVNGALPRNARLLLVGDAQALYYKRPSFANSVFDEQFFEAAAREEKDAEGILRRVKELGVSYVAFCLSPGVENAREYHQYELSGDEWRKLYDFSQRGLEPLPALGSFGLFRVRESLSAKRSFDWNPFTFFPPEASRFYECQKNKDAIGARKELDQLVVFFPGDPVWKNQKIEPVKKAR
jgi:hypothetical protein